MSTYSFQFQSTPSARRATSFPEECICILEISIHALREESDVLLHFPIDICLYFNPRPPRGERRYNTEKGGDPMEKFQSTPSARRATHGRFQRRGDCIISIHALREESDSAPSVCTAGFARFRSTPSARRATLCILLRVPLRIDFNPRPPRGERPNPRFC